MFYDERLTLSRWQDDDLPKNYIGYIEEKRVTVDTRILNLPCKKLEAIIERTAAITSWTLADSTYYRERSCFEHAILLILRDMILKDKPVIFFKDWDTLSPHPICYVIKEACKEYSTTTSGVTINSISSNIREEWRINPAVPDVDTKGISSSFINKLVHSVAKEIWLTLPIGTTIAVSIEYQPPIYLVVDRCNS